MIWLMSSIDLCLSNIYTFILSFYVEQYDAFVKFNYDQVQRRFQETAPTCEYRKKNLKREIYKNLWATSNLSLQNL